MGLVKLVRDVDISEVERPLLIIYSPNDQMISPERVEETFTRFGAANKQLIPIDDPEDPGNHVLAGDILSPGDTAQVVQMILDFVSSLKWFFSG